MSLATLASSGSAAGGGGVTTQLAKNDWEVRKEGAPTPFFQETGCEEKERNMLVCSIQEDARREKGLENGTWK